jgi:hypothetical protein
MRDRTDGLMSRICDVLFLDPRIEMVFDRIVCSTYLCDLPALKTSGDFFPFVPVSPMCLKDDAFLLICPLSFVDVWIKVVMPSTYHTCVPLTTLLTGARL